MSLKRKSECGYETANHRWLSIQASNSPLGYLIDRPNLMYGGPRPALRHACSVRCDIESKRAASFSLSRAASSIIDMAILFGLLEQRPGACISRRSGKWPTDRRMLFRPWETTSKRSHTRVLINARTKKPGSTAGRAVVLLCKGSTEPYCCPIKSGSVEL